MMSHASYSLLAQSYLLVVRSVDFQNHVIMNCYRTNLAYFHLVMKDLIICQGLTCFLVLPVKNHVLVLP